MSGDYGDLEWQLKQMQNDMTIMWNRLNDLEEARDEKEKPDAGEPTGRYLVDCLKQNVKLVEENDVLRYQYEAMKNETARCKGLFDQLVKENQRLEEDIRGAHEKVKELEKLIDDYKVGAMGIRKRILELEDDNKEQQNLIKLYEAANADMAKKIKELDKPYATQLNDYIDALASIGKKSKEIDELTKKYEGEKAAAINLEESSTYWQQKYNKQLQTTDILYKELDFYRKMTHDLELEKNDAKWYREQAIEKCIDIVERIKNDPLTGLTGGECKRWMFAICEDIQKVIKKEFGVK